MSTHFRGRAGGSRGHGGSFSRGGHGRPYGRPPQRAGGRNRPQKTAHIDVSRFINKATVTAETPAYEPAHTFSDFAIDPRIKHNIGAKGYATPTPIQDQAIPAILGGRDIVGIAATGTGKTGAFLIPLLNKVVKDRKQRVLIMVPTRELALQIEEEYRGFSRGSGFGSVCAVGGININPQIRALSADPYFVIGTPGRLKDLMERRAIDLSRFRTVVLDEADRMLDMGFIHDMKFIMGKLPASRHTLFFSATLSREIEALIGQFLREPARISLKSRDTAASVEQDIVRVPGGKNKLDVLHELLAQPEFNKVVVFGRTKHGVERLAKNLVQRGFRADSIHGNKAQNARQRALAKFKSDQLQVLVATDVAARGIDIDDVSHVINYDLPTTYDDYVHRIGRTGRAGKQGKALTFVD